MSFDPKKSRRFDYVKYDDHAIAVQSRMKHQCQILEHLISQDIKSPRNVLIVLARLEEVYMWIGKGIRDDQIARNVSAELQEERANE